MLNNSQFSTSPVDPAVRPRPGRARCAGARRAPPGANSSTSPRRSRCGPRKHIGTTSPPPSGIKRTSGRLFQASVGVVTHLSSLNALSSMEPCMVRVLTVQST